jgi:hypothetical protein|nr:hypothetical protein [Candidatus Krumholzibacteria bacterium]
MSNSRLSRDQRRRLFRQRVRRALDYADQSFRGKYREEMDALMGMSREEIDAITPEVTDLRVYDALVTVVKEASRVNLSQADLRARIEELGEVAVSIARRVPGLAGLLG